MRFNNHYALTGKHAIFGASNYHWINYDVEKLITVYDNLAAKEHGTRLHAFAAECISLRQKLPRSKKTLNSYVNDAISMKLEPEQVLYFSDNFFGTADAIGFNSGELRIHDLKTGKIPAHVEQLEIYAALFCLEYHISPADIFIELRIYQNDEIVVHIPEVEAIMDISNKIIEFDRILNTIKEDA